MPPRRVWSNSSDANLDRSVALNTTVSGLTHLTGLTSDCGTTENADAPSAVTDQSGSPLLRMRDEAKRESFALMDNIGLGNAFANSYEEEQSKASSSKLESYLNKKRSTPQPQIQRPYNGLTSEEYKAALLASSEYTSFDDNSVISRKHHIHRAQGWFPWELDARHLDHTTAPPEQPANNNSAGIAPPRRDHTRQPEEATGMPASFGDWGQMAAKAARTLLGRCHVLMDEHDVDEWVETASSTFRKALRAGRAQCVASCNAAS
mmetsp:Transcript_2398/g.6947  ORF Transcript_2398/g.6947 Transcript_2398/m.6947 type:complete len:263 (+) Transcript_2398:233-1021(+)|eukprot:CAMPEP_0181050584 /NCGR_PEP_ID=MMETSP1070-20121207/16594_1 /TAXON_ID=265543 /ORGANISM="Minutocellus polymorphus, Strain NH13" /LENGTH=262 /DNA_ID=CAMNT_0023129539 /DNA_START=199 /DNA_END=987 /DNA_ORIENTATION=-